MILGGAVPPNPSGLDLDDIQGMAVPRLPFPVRTPSSSARRRPDGGAPWLGRLAGQLTTAAALDGDPDHALNAALTWRGFEALGLSANSLQSFPEAFRQGMAARAARLGDTGDSAPDHWDKPFGAAAVHVLVVISAMTDAVRAAAEQRLIADLDGPGNPVVIYRQDVGLLPSPDGSLKPIEHFGYRDGIAKVAIEGNGVPQVPGQGVFEGGSWRPLKAGEFVLGHADETGNIAPGPEPAALGFNGAYLVLRKLHQHVARFRDFLHQAADTDEAHQLIAAKMMGRWPSGAPLARAAESDNPTLADDAGHNNDFTYADDAKGVVVPIGAHIRRVNPRRFGRAGGRLGQPPSRAAPGFALRNPPARRPR